MLSNFIKNIFRKFSNKAREKRGQLFLALMKIEPETKILDLGGGTGVHIASVLKNRPCNVTVADISKEDLLLASEKFRFNTVRLSESGKLPFDDNEFDIVFCSSVIEHVTGEKKTILALNCSKEFKKVAKLHQQEFAEEIKRISKGYFVQTPYRYFPIESHSWLPVAVVFLNRKNLKQVLKFFGSWWPKKQNLIGI